METKKTRTDLYHQNSHLYDIIFSWDVKPEVDWLIQKLGADVKTVLEPGCGSGRMFPDFIKSGITIVGIDVSETMLARADERMSRLNLSNYKTICADMSDFNIRQVFDGAICPINTFGYLQNYERALSHLKCVANHLAPNRKYLLQVDIRDVKNYAPASDSDINHWEVKKSGIRVKAAWIGVAFNSKTRIETQRSCLEILEGPEKGRVIEEEHHIRLWDWDEWQDLIVASPFQQVAAYDGNSFTRKKLSLGPGINTAYLTWHELVRKKQ